jgi:hypothetical protein
LTRVEFLSGTTVIGSVTTSPFSFTWRNVPAGSYTLQAIAYDAAGASATSAVVTVTVAVEAIAAPRLVVFSASADHNTTAVTSYVLEIFASGDDPATWTPVASSDLGQPEADANGEISVERAAFFSGLAPGSYIATVGAVGPGGQGRSAPAAFIR